MPITSITIRRPDDFHVHFRQDAENDTRLSSVVHHTARQFGRAIVMPNTSPFVLTVEDAARYRDQILQAVPRGVNFTPLMTLYLQAATSPETIRDAKKCGFVHGMKLYPAGGTTNSHGGVRKLTDVEEQFAVMQEVGMPLLIHGELADQECDVFERETQFYTDAFPWLTSNFPGLPIVCEHITTATAVEMIERSSHKRLGATITPQHLLADRNDMLGRGGIRPGYYCMPILKQGSDRRALLSAATSGNPKFFLGTDSAPHPMYGEAGKAKYSACGCAGCFTASCALELYAEAFDSVRQIDRLGDFASRFGAEFYQLPCNEGMVELVRQEWSPAPKHVFGASEVATFRAEKPLQWKLAD